MFRELVVILLIALELLLLASFQSARKFVVHPKIGYIRALNHKELLAMLYVLAVGRTYGTFAKREVVDRIEQIGLPHPIATDKAVDLGRQCKFHRSKTPVVEYGYTVQ